MQDDIMGLHALQDAITILFSFKRMGNVEEEFSKDIDIWLSTLVRIQNTVIITNAYQVLDLPQYQIFIFVGHYKSVYIYVYVIIFVYMHVCSKENITKAMILRTNSTWLWLNRSHHNSFVMSFISSFVKQFLQFLNSSYEICIICMMICYLFVYFSPLWG